eukprot:8928349-Pyramimonas_sp.AAC.1
MGAPREEKEVRHWFLSYFVKALCGSAPKVFPRSRWTGADLTLDALGILDGVHGIGMPAFLRFAIIMNRGAVPKSLLPAAGGAEIGAPAIPDAQPVVGVAGEPEDQKDVVEDQRHAANAEHKFEKENNHQREVAARWLLHDSPHAIVVALRVTMEPFRVLLKDLLTLSGKGWEFLEREKHFGRS